MTQTTKSPVKKSNVEVKVLAVNTLYEWAEKFYQYEKQHFQQFVGKAIFKADGSIKSKYEHQKISHEGRLADGTYVHAHYWFTSRYNSFDIHVKICVNGGSYDDKPSTAFCQYEERAIELFKINEAGELVENSNDIEWLKKRYDVAELTAIANDVKEAAKVYEAAHEKMPYIFQEVFYIERLTR